MFRVLLESVCFTPLRTSNNLVSIRDSQPRERERERERKRETEEESVFEWCRLCDTLNRVDRLCDIRVHTHTHMDISIPLDFSHNGDTVMLISV